MFRSRRMRQALRSRLDRVAPRVRPAAVRGPGPSVYLTFDDGPSAGYTEAIAAALEARGFTGTFFFSGSSAVAHPEVVRRVAAGGHAVGSHSSTHPKSWVTGLPFVFRDYRRGHREVEAALGSRVRLFRPPYGTHDAAASLFSLTSRSKLVLWSCEAEDWLATIDAATIVGRIEPHLEPGAIVLLHDHIIDTPAAANRSETVRAVSMLADALVAKGLRAERIA